MSDCTRAAFQVRERLPGQEGPAVRAAWACSEAAYDAMLTQARDWPGAHHLIEITPHALTTATSDRVTAPVYLTAVGNVLHAHWDITRLRGVLADTALDPVEVARSLALSGHYSNRTVYRAVHLLTERRRAHLQTGVLTFTDPPGCEHDQARELADGALVVDGYTEMLDSVLADRFYDAQATAVELSGGMDSSNVALSLAARHGPGIAAGALLQDGAPGTQQARRRAALIAYCGLVPDTTLRAGDFLPLDPRHTGALERGAHEELYVAGHSRLLDSWHRDGVRWAVTGVGGDEMLSLPTAGAAGRTISAIRAPSWFTERTREALADGTSGISPAPAISDSTLRAISTGAPMYLRAGIWPLYPLADPCLFRFGQWLPAAWRSGKRLARERIQRCGLPWEVAYPSLRENFRPVWREATARFGPGLARQMVKGSVLIDEGYVDPVRLEEAAERIETGRLLDGDLMLGHTLLVHHALV